MQPVEHLTYWKVMRRRLFSYLKNPKKIGPDLKDYLKWAFYCEGKFNLKGGLYKIFFTREYGAYKLKQRLKECEDSLKKNKSDN